MAECQVFRNSQGSIERVTAPNGQDSILYEDILKDIPNKEAALREWAKIYTPSFKQQFGDWEQYFGDITGGKYKLSTTELPISSGTLREDDILRAGDGSTWVINSREDRQMTGEDLLALHEDGIYEDTDAEFDEQTKDSPYTYTLDPISLRKDGFFDDLVETQNPIFGRKIEDLRGWKLIGSSTSNKDEYRAATAKLFRGKLDENGEPLYKFFPKQLQLPNISDKDVDEGLKNCDI